MAELGFVKTNPQLRVFHFLWTGLGDSDTGTEFSYPGASDKSVQVSGTFDDATVVVQGSNQRTPTVWATLHDVNGDALSFTAAGLEVISENPLWVRVETSGGSGSAAIDVIILARSTP